MVSTAFALLIGNLFHAFIALVWVGGLKRFAGPLNPDFEARIFGFALFFPALITFSQVLGVPGPPEGYIMMRVQLWAAGFLDLRTAFFAIFIFFLGGIALIFLFQEFLPFWKWRRGRLHDERASDARLSAALDRVRTKYEQLGLPSIRGHKLRAFCLATDVPVAALHGVIDPELLVSRGLLERLNEDELEAVVSHEYAHHAYGGNLNLFVLWLFRALQAANPATLIMFRSLVEARERACDSMAVLLTGKPEALASAIMKAYDEAVPGETTHHEETTERQGPAEQPAGALAPTVSVKLGQGKLIATARGELAQAREELLRRAERLSTRYRVEALLKGVASRPAPGWASWLTGLVLGGFLWMVR